MGQSIIASLSCTLGVTALKQGADHVTLLRTLRPPHSSPCDIPESPWCSRPRSVWPSCPASASQAGSELSWAKSHEVGPPLSHRVWAFPCAVWGLQQSSGFLSVCSSFWSHLRCVSSSRSHWKPPRPVSSLLGLLLGTEEESQFLLLLVHWLCLLGRADVLKDRHGVCMFSTALKVLCALPAYSTCLHPGTWQPLSLLLPP